MRVTGSAPYSAVLLPDEAIGSDQTNKFVYAVDDDGTVVRSTSSSGRCTRACAWCARACRRRMGDHQGPAAGAARHQGGAQARGADLSDAGKARRQGGRMMARTAATRVGRAAPVSISRFFIDRPIFAAVVALVITIIGAIGYTASASRSCRRSRRRPSR